MQMEQVNEQKSLLRSSRLSWAFRLSTEVNVKKVR